MEIHGHPDLTTDEEMAYLAGLAEGIHTGELIYMSYKNTINDFCEQESSFCQKLQTFLDSNMKFLKENIANNPKSDYWKLVSHHVIVT